MAASLLGRLAVGGMFDLPLILLAQESTGSYAVAGRALAAHAAGISAPRLSWRWPADWPSPSRRAGPLQRTQVWRRGRLGWGPGALPCSSSPRCSQTPGSAPWTWRCPLCPRAGRRRRRRRAAGAVCRRLCPRRHALRRSPRSRESGGPYGLADRVRRPGTASARACRLAGGARGPAAVGGHAVHRPVGGEVAGAGRRHACRAGRRGLQLDRHRQRRRGRPGWRDRRGGDRNGRGRRCSFWQAPAPPPWRQGWSWPDAHG